MRSWLTDLVLLTWGVVLLSGLPVRGQEKVEASKPAADRPAAAAPRLSQVQEVTPSGLYLRNERGDLVYVPDVSFEEFEQLLLQRQSLAMPQRPAFTIKDMAIQGQVREDQLLATVVFTLEGIELDQVPRDTWFQVPLQFREAYLQAEPKFAGPGQHFLTFDADKDGYICWLQMTGNDTRHEVTLNLLLPVHRVGEEQSVALQAPSPLASTLSLTVPENPAEGTIEDQSKAERILAFSVDDAGQGHFEARGIRGDVTLSWHKSRAAEQRADVRLDVYGTIIVTADELLQEVRSDGRFVVSGFGGPTEVFQVRLPPGMRLRELPEQGYEVRTLPDGADVATAGQLVEVRLDRPTSGETHVRLVAELPAADEDPSWLLSVSRLVDAPEQFTPAQFHFATAARHRGQIDLVVKGDWTLFWADDTALPRTQPAGPSTANDRLVARFRYFDQDEPLRVWIRQQPARVTIEPAYDIFLDTQQAQLQANLVCRTSGSKAGNLKLNLPGWTAETVTFVDIDASLPVNSSGNSVIIPIPMEAQASGRFSLQIEAWQALSPDVITGDAPLQIAIPSVSAENPARTTTLVTPANVTMFPADNVRLTPRQPDMQALSPQIIPVSPGGAGATNDVAPGLPQQYARQVFRYRDRGASEQAVFVGDFKIQPQAISVTLDSRVTIDRRSYGIEQSLTYRVLHEAVEELQLVFPAPLAESDQQRVRILLSDEPLTPVFSSGSGSRIPVRVRLPEPKLGPIELRVIHPRKPLAELAADRKLRLDVPLVYAATGPTTNTTVIGNNMTVVYQDPLHVEVTGSAWTVTDSDSGLGRLTVSTAADHSDAVLELSLSGESLASSTILDQVWIQTWLTGSKRSDRCVYRLRTSEAELHLRLPRGQGGDISAVEVAVDDVRVAVTQEEDQLVVSLDGTDGEVQSHVLEAWYQIETNEGSSRWLSIQPATLDAVDHVNRCYWQLILPRGEAVVWSDQAQFSALQWQGWTGWQRTALREQRDLETWIGTAHQEAVPASFNTYLFTSLGAPQQLTVRTGSRPLILLTMSGSVLVVGLLLIYFPVLRHPATWLALGLLLASAALLVPELALLAAQAACLGILLTFLAQGLSHVLLAKRRATTVQGRAQFSDSKIEVRYTRPDGSSKAHTATASAVTHTPSAESHP